MLGMIAGMGGMAGATGASSLGFVDMEIMQVERAVAEIGEIRGLFGLYQGGLMTTETEIVVFHIEGSVELRWEFLNQQSEMIAAVRDMAGTAFFLLYRAVEELFIFDLLLEVGDFLAVFERDRLVMAFNT